MKTFVTQLSNNGTYKNGETFHGSFGYYKSVAIEITNPDDRNWGCFLVKFVTDSVTLSLEGATFRYGTTLENAKNSVIPYSSMTLSPNTNHYIYIPGPFTAILKFSDITRLDTFDASINTGSSVATYEGIDIDAKDLMKFSLVRDLGLRYCVRHLNYFNERNFMYFTNLERLYIGAPNDETLLETIHLPDGVMRSLTDLNWGIKVLPANFNELKRCENVYLLNGASWRNLHSAVFSSTVKCYIIHTDPYNTEDIPTIQRFRNAYSLSGYTILIPSQL